MIEALGLIEKSGYRRTLWHLLSKRLVLSPRRSSSFKWHLEPQPLSFAELGEMGFKFIFITLAAIHANGLGFGRRASRGPRALARSVFNVQRST